MRTTTAVRAAETSSAPEAGHVSAGNKATGHVLRVLAEFADGAESFGVTELSRRLGMTKNKVHRALTTLVRHGYVIRDETGTRYELGLRAVHLSSARMRSLDLPALCEPYLERMRELSGETVSLSVPVGRMQVTVHGLRGHGAVARRVPLGTLTPLHAGPASRAILAFLPDDEIASILGRPLVRYTDATLTTPTELWEEIATVRKHGYATGYGDHVPNARGVSFPLLDRTGRPHGAITVSGPEERFDEQAIERVLPELKQVSDELNRHTRLYSATPITERDGA